jgi:hypothetical protein
VSRPTLEALEPRDAPALMPGSPVAEDTRPAVAALFAWYTCYTPDARIRRDAVVVRFRPPPAPAAQPAPARPPAPLVVMAHRAIDTRRERLDAPPGGMRRRPYEVLGMPEEVTAWHAWCDGEAAAGEGEEVPGG